MKELKGISIVLDINRSTRASIELENGKNGRIKNRLLNKIIVETSYFDKNILTYKRTSGVIFFIEDCNYNKENIEKILNNIYWICKKNVKKFNQYFNDEELFKDSYGAEFSDNNILFDIFDNKEIIGLAVNIAFKIATHSDNQQNLYIGKNLASYISHENKTLNAINGVVWPAYLKKIHQNFTIQVDDLRVYNGFYKENNDGAIYFVVDVINSTKSLIMFDAKGICIKLIKIFTMISDEFKKLGFKQEFRGDGILFWKHGTISNSKIYMNTLNLANKIQYDSSFKEPRSTNNLLRLKKVGMENIRAKRSHKLKMGVDSSQTYLFLSSNEPSLSPHKVLAEIAEKLATAEYKTVSGESFLQKLYMNDKDYVKLAKTINKYNLFYVVNEYLKMSINQYKNRWVPRIWRKYKNIDFNKYNEGTSYVKNFGKEAREANQLDKRIGHMTESTSYNGLHFYITSNNKYLQVFVNDGNGGFVEYGS